MTPDDVLSIPRSDDSIIALSRAWRKAVGIDAEVCPDMLWVIENTVPSLFPNFALMPRTKSELREYFAVTSYIPPKIEIREDVYIALARSHPKAREIAAHELGHLVMHQSLPKSLKDGRQERKLLSAVQKSMSVEHQADTFAFGFLVPEHLVQGHDINQVVAEFRVPAKLAIRAARRFKLSPRRRLYPYEVMHLQHNEDEPFSDKYSEAIFAPAGAA